MQLLKNIAAPTDQKITTYPMPYALCLSTFEVMLTIIEAIWFLFLLVISMYHLFIFRRRNINQPRDVIQDLPGVSVIIAVRNGTSQLSENLRDIIHQDYPVFEVIIVDDHSDPVERKTLEEFISLWPNVKLITSNAPGKKNALMTGVVNSKYDFVLLTDADCRPISSDWFRTMIESSHGQDVVIGYSPYQKVTGLLNLLIRFETVMTGIQYLSWAMKGRPYMAVGRNILYPRSLLLTGNPFRHHQDIPYGDDDLGLQALTGKYVVSVCLERKAHVISAPAVSWIQWLRQKHRHLSAGHYYKPGVWWQPGIYGLALAGHWFLLPFISYSLAWWNWLPIFAVGLSMRWITYFHWTERLGDRDTSRWYPLLEILYAAYLVVMGTVTILAKKKTWS